jgi:hypothetical protein
MRSTQRAGAGEEEQAADQPTQMPEFQTAGEPFVRADG